MKAFFITFFYLFLSITILSAIEIESRIPPSVWEIKIDFKYTPSYSNAYNGYGEKSPLYDLILRDFEWRENVKGELERE